MRVYEGDTVLKSLRFPVNIEKGANAGKSKKVLKASYVKLLEKFLLSASQNNLNVVVGASHYVIDFHYICISLCVDTLCIGIGCTTTFKKICTPCT